MSLKRCIAFVTVASAAGLIALACSGPSSGGATPAETDGGQGASDAKSDHTASGGADTGPAGDSPGPMNCTPLDTVAGFTPKWTPPAAHKDVCSQQNIDDFRKFCLGTGDANACNSFLATQTGKACAACILTAPTAA